ncbi:Long-chain-fatty-acid--CoA ligase [Falsiruegeria litorea R37]|uniref:3-methylmercaptopropionyl-CoA ligase n=1 Tax=Falsiruegeria litorea R37 TaxID=1200284 RepID=A0A1Y5S5M8_9RHOB|nr:AMP-binding protein [Falsiruegeria litorea]SLN32650.1 Long-chain-fatty-acid--CoA ligase [Falsiruegeria litorea R37]
MRHHFEALRKKRANHVPLSPLSFLRRAECLHGVRTAVIYGDIRRTWAETAARIRAVAGGLVELGVQKGDTVSVLSPNIPELFELHFALPLTGGVLNTLNTRLEPETIAYILDHADTKLVIVDRELVPLLSKAFELLGRALPVVEIADPVTEGETLGGPTYEALTGAAPLPVELPADEWDAIALNYTSGTSGRPKGVVYHHRGAYLMALGTGTAWQVPPYPVYLSVVPMFHCNGWGHPWLMAMLGATVVFTRVPAADRILEAIRSHGVTHFGAAPIVLQMLAEAESDAAHFDPAIRVLTAGAPPPPTVLEKTRAMGFDVMQVYGLTETYGHISQCLWQDDWDDLDPAEQAELQAQQGIAFPMVEEVTVIDRSTGAAVTRNGTAQGEIAIRGNTVMAGYYKDTKATAEAFEEGWFWSGDGAVMHENGYIQIRDRLKDVIISGGENISSVEVEAVLYRHDAVQAAAVVAMPHEKWGEVPCAFVELREGAEATSDDIIAFCREHLAGFKAPKAVAFETLPKTSTGKIQKFQLRERAKSKGSA